jgi:hypothetical protein
MKIEINGIVMKPCFQSDGGEVLFPGFLGNPSFCFLGCFREWLRLNWNRTWVGLSRASSEQVMR